MQDLILYNNDVIVVQSGGKVYHETKENFFIDYHREIEYQNIDYNRNTKSCWINGKPFQEFPNEICENILGSIEMLIYNKSIRETPPITLEDVKLAKIAEMKAERDRIQELPIEYNGKSFDYNKESLQKLNEAKDCLEGTDEKQIWICADNSLTYLTYEDIMAIKRLGKDRSNEVHIQYAKLKYLIEMRNTIVSVQSITFDKDTSFIPLDV